MRVALLLCVVGCVPIKTSSSSSSSASGYSSSSSSSGEPTGQNAPDNRDTGTPSREPPAGLATMIALSPPPTRLADGTVSPPGGPLSTAAADCSAAKGHCLRGTYFANTGRTGSGRGALTPVFIFEGMFYTWDGKPTDRLDAAFRNTAATPQNLVGARQVVVFEPSKQTDFNEIPRNEWEALVDGNWNTTTADTDGINAAAGTFENKNLVATYKIGSSRVMLEWINAK